MKHSSTKKIGATLVALLLSGSFTVNAQEAPVNEALNINPLSHSLYWGGCPAGTMFPRYATGINYLPGTLKQNEGAPKTRPGQESAILTAIGTSLVTRGVDAIGNAIKSSSEKKTYSVKADLNVLTDRPQDCLTFRGPNGSYRFVIKMMRDESGALVIPSLVEYDYARNIAGGLRTRGVVLTLGFRRPGDAETTSQSITLGNLKPSSYNRNIRTAHVVPMMANPFVKQEPTTKKILPGYPFVTTVTLTEVRDANRLLTFVGDVSDDVNDDATQLLIKVIGAEPASTDQTLSTDGGAPGGN